MALNGDTLGTAIKDAVTALTPSEKLDLELAWQTIANEITDHMDNFWDKICPIGSVIPWHKSMAGVPSLPIYFLECNGQVINDSDSPMDGETLPDLNGDERFLRGGSTSGTEQDDAFQGHWHDVHRNSGSGADFSFGGTFSSSKLLSTSPIEARDPKTDGVNGTPKIADETRPINMSVVFVMRIK